jgi:Toprim domain
MSYTGSRVSDLAEVKLLLQARIDELAQQLAPEGKRSGAYWMCKSMAHDAKIGGMWIVLTGTPGAWRDEVTGSKGDILGLIAYKVQLAGIGDALKWARDWLGIQRVNPAELKRATATLKAKADECSQRTEQRAEQQRKDAFAYWLKCWDSLEGTDAARYLLGRGIDITKLARPPSALRYAPRCHHTEAKVDLPTIVALMTGRDEQPCAIHRTFLAPGGISKAGVEPERKIWPSFKGAAIRLARGETGLTPNKALEKGKTDRLLICEGLEDGLSVALACPELRVWAAGSLGNIGQLTLPKCSLEVIIAADNDWGKPQAEQALNAGIAALQAQGVRVLIARSTIGKDVNDALRASQ